MTVKESGDLKARNPFSPSFGISPPVLAGRGDVLDGIGDALATGPTHPDYTTLLVGVRGAGKTVMLNAVEELARSRGWLTLAESASPAGLPSRLTLGTSDLLTEIAPTKAKRQISSITAAGFGVGFKTGTGSERDPDLRWVLITEHINQHGRSVSSEALEQAVQLTSGLRIHASTRGLSHLASSRYGPANHLYTCRSRSSQGYDAESPRLVKPRTVGTW